MTCGGETRCLQGEGRCKQNTLPMNFLKKTAECQKVTQRKGTEIHEVFLEKWKLVTEDIRTSCECQILEKSHFKALTKAKTLGKV